MYPCYDLGKVHLNSEQIFFCLIKKELLTDESKVDCNLGDCHGQGKHFNAHGHLLLPSIARMEVSTGLFQDSGEYWCAVAFVPQVAKKSSVNICSFLKCVPSLSPDRVHKFDNIS